jgi:UDP-2,3-diacylglucosamine pyrophosphatase LpxH
MKPIYPRAATMMLEHFDYAVISDLHLNSSVCVEESLHSFIREVVDERILVNQLIVLGDMFDNHNFNKMNDKQLQILRLLQLLYRSKKLITIAGNHDCPISRIEALTGFHFINNTVLTYPNKKIYLEHGDAADDFLKRHHILTAVGEWIYYILQKIDSTHRLARVAKNSSKCYAKSTKKVADYALAALKDTNYSVAMCGHTHQATFAQMGGYKYYNVGCWTEKPCTLATITSTGEVQIRTYRKNKGGLSDPLFIEAEVV